METYFFLLLLEGHSRCPPESIFFDIFSTFFNKTGILILQQDGVLNRTMFAIELNTEKISNICLCFFLWRPQLLLQLFRVPYIYIYVHVCVVKILMKLIVTVGETKKRYFPWQARWRKLIQSCRIKGVLSVK